MTCLTILEYPDPRLRTRAVPVAAVDASLRELIDDMFETMYAAKGIGLAATQVNVHRRLLVTDVSEGHTDPRVFINPEILARTARPSRRRAASRCPATSTKSSAPNGSACVRSTGTASRSRPTSRACSRSACSTRSTTSTASCSWITCPTSSASACARRSRRSGELRAEGRARRDVARAGDLTGSMPIERGLAVVFAGTPAFALASLDAIAASRHRIAAVFTQPDRPSGRGRALAASPVKERALALGLPIRQPASLKDADAAAEIAALAPGRDSRRRLRPAAAARDPRGAKARLPQRARFAAAALARRRAGCARDPRR